MIPSLRGSVISIIESAFPALIYGHPRTYVVAAVRADKRLDLVPVADAASYLPELPAVEQWGLGVVTPTVGTEVCVLFRDADKGRPIVVPWGFGSVPETVKIDADAEIDLGDPATRGAARMDDAIEAGSWSFGFAAGTLTVTYTPSTGVPKSFTIEVVAGVLVFTPIPPYAGGAIATTGKITSASAKTKVE